MPDYTKHPDKSILLAHARHQRFENWLAIQQHVDVDECPVCLPQCNSYRDISEPLEVLGRMHLPYEPIKGRVLRRIEESEQRDHPKVQRRLVLPVLPGRALRTIGPLLAAALLILCVVMIGALAHLPTTTSVQPGSRSTFLVQPTSPPKSPTPKRHSMLKPTPKSKPVPTPTLTPVPISLSSPTPTVEPGPSIVMCSTPTEIAHFRLHICGHNFQPGDKVLLILYFSKKPPRQLPMPLANWQGYTEIMLNIVNCSQVPIAIQAQDLTHPSDSPKPLEAVPFGNCPVPTQTPPALH